MSFQKSVENPVKKEKVLIIKLGYSETLDNEIGLETSLGDVLRTTVILHHFKDNHVTWLIDEKAYPLLEGNPLIDRTLIYDLSTVLQLKSERFDTIVNFEKVPGVCALADSISAWRRWGFRFDEIDGVAQAYGGAEEVYRISQDENAKKENKKYWQEALYDVFGAKWKGEEYVLGYKPSSKVEYDIGFNHAVGKKWPNKEWPEKYWKELEEMLGSKYKCSWQKGFDNLHEYIEWINSCKAIITTDSLGLHIGVTLKKKILTIYGPTHSGETFLYNRGIEILPPESFDCVPCLKPFCDKETSCMQSINPKAVYDKVKLLFD
jgi:heptosyltransferase-2